MLRASETIKKLSLELGGKSPNLILEDADFATVIPRAVGMVSCNSGQGCVLPTRVLVPRSRYEEAVELAAMAYGSISVGDPHDANTAIGPVNSRAQFDRVLGYIEKGKVEGARLVVGGKASTKFSKGYYIEPTVFADVEPHHTIAREEIFGPVVSIIGYDDEEDAIRIANDHLYGLSGVVWSSDDAHAMRVARRIRSGTISVNGANFFFPDLPFGGYRQSGLGLESGVPGFESFLESKSIAQVSSRAL